MRWIKLEEKQPDREDCLVVSKDGDLCFLRWDGQLYKIIPVSRGYCCIIDDITVRYPNCGNCTKSMWLYINDPQWQRFTHWIPTPLPIEYQDPPSTECCPEGCAKEQEERERKAYM